MLFAISPKCPEHFKEKYSQLSLKINILLRKIWQLSNVRTAFFLSTAESDETPYYSATVRENREMSGNFPKSRKTEKMTETSGKICLITFICFPEWA